MAPDSINTTGGDIAVNGRRYRLPQQPVVVEVVGLLPGVGHDRVGVGDQQPVPHLPVSPTAKTGQT